jgi:hypothetical protein
MPDYLVLLSTLGGLAAFGLAGIVIGPIIAAFFLSVWEMAQAEFAHDELAHADAYAHVHRDHSHERSQPAGVEAERAPAMLGRGSEGAPETYNDKG